MSESVLAIYKIGGAKWTVREGEVADTDIATTSIDHCITTLTPGLPTDRFEITLRHELIHVFISTLGLGLADDVEERIAQGLAHAWYAFDVDNPGWERIAND